MADITKPLLKDEDVWASSVLEDDIIIPYEKIDEGWGYANKPSYQYLNWFWNTQTQFYVHLNQNGIPEWDKNTIYESAGMAKFNGMLFQSFSKISGQMPIIDSRLWRSFEFINGLYDVDIDMPGYRDLLVHKDEIWENLTPIDIIMPLGGIKNVVDTGHLETIMGVNDVNQSASDAWTNKSISDIIDNTLNISDFEDTRINNPIDSEILQYRPYNIWNEEDKKYEKQFRWQNTYYQGYVNFNNIENKPQEFKCVPATRNVVGGVRMWVDTTTSSEPIFHIEPSRHGYVPKSYGLETSTDENGKVILKWKGTSVADKYYIYRDNVKVGETNSTENYYTDPVNDNEWHVYYVTSIDITSGETYESDPSNYSMGKAI